MALARLLIANRGEIAVRVARAAADLAITSVAVHSADDAGSPHAAAADERVALDGNGPAAYLDVDAVVRAALDAGCDAVHPGYGFLSERAAFAQACEAAGLVFVGPRPETLAALGDKATARTLAAEAGVPVPDGTGPLDSLDEAAAFLDRCVAGGGAMMLKAVGGGGGRGMRVVRTRADLEEAFDRARSEAGAAFGDDRVYAEELIERARHVEVQVLGDGDGTVTHLWDRECSLQRRHQKIIEIAPSPGLHPELRDRILDAALDLAATTRYRNAGTVELLVDASSAGVPDGRFVFIEANARLQVEHTVTEEVTGVDLVATQLRLAGGATLAELGLTRDAVPAPRGFAVQARVNTETMAADGTIRPTGGTIERFEPPTGPGVRVDTYARGGYRTNPRFDSLLAKVVAHAVGPDVADALRRTDRALRELRIEGVATNRPFLRAVLADADVLAGRTHTRLVEERLGDLVAAAERLADPDAEAARRGGGAGARVDRSDPLAVLDHGRATAAASASAPTADQAPDGTEAVVAPLQGTIVAITVAEGEAVRAGQQLMVMEAMKMEHVITAPESGYVRELPVEAGDTVFEGHALAFVEPADVEAGEEEAAAEVDLDAIRADLAEVLDRHAIGLDDRRPDAVARRRKTGHRTARENIDDLCDGDSFVEYGPLVIAAQRRRREVDELIERTPADGLIGGVATVNADRVGAERAQTLVMSYDYTVLAGTQGLQNHRKKDRLIELAARQQLPTVVFAEGGGGRPGDTDSHGGSGLDVMTFHDFARLSGLVPLVGITTGRCFAGNAALLGCCDVVIATEGSNIGMGGPAMIEGGGLGVFRPEEVGPMDVQVPNGVVDIAVADEAEAVEVARRYLGYFQGPVDDWDCDDQRRLRSIIPENRLRIYDVRQVIDTMADTGSVLELRRAFGPGMVTSLARIEGMPVGIVANDPTHLAGAIDSDGADKAARFLQLCEAFDVPVLFLCDTPGMMVGPEVERTALVRHCSRLFVTGANLTVPYATIILRKGYGLGAQAMAGGSFKAPLFCIAWPTGEFGGMGLEGAVKLGYRNELAAIEDPEERRETFQKMVDRMYEHGKATSTASFFEIDDVIDPAESRRWIASALRSAPTPPPRDGKKRPFVDTW
ncbi:MAG: carboxyl transferase domain-containing protein [Actinomycetota bacterium]|nr:carboxyl transferase domain-containing protein [Actinomycetota bacterium]